MAGVGEATAILEVAELGFGVSSALIDYTNEVKDAPGRIKSIGDEIKTTSKRLQEIARLVEKNSQTRLFSQEGLQNVLRCSDECYQAIGEVRFVLRKTGYQRNPVEFDRSQLDISYHTKLQWPLIKTKLEVPRTALQRIKIDLSLLFASVMAISA